MFTVLKAKMGDWISDALLFSAGIAGGVLIMTLVPILRADKRRRTELVAARSRILADLKDKHEAEILDEAFRTTQAIRGELNQYLQALRKTVDAVLTATNPPKNGRQ